MSEENCEMLIALLDNIYGKWLDIISSTRGEWMWREIKLLAASKPDIESMSDVAASGGYYMAMAADAIVAENLTLTSSIGVVTDWLRQGNHIKGNLQRLEEAELFAKSAQNSYKQFQDKAASSKSMTIEKMEEVAQGRVWAGKDAALRDLVNAIGGLSQVVAIAKLKANIPQDTELFDWFFHLFHVTLVELARPSPSLPKLLSGVGSTLEGVAF
ncbi:putative peptidase S49, ClpP/crotonase-like domain-containing protein [Rosa chinensis]|uniref:Putative peptidase S49, ClpP/crotonase-like domain-containing protein n=1 Tax=Rosa chinensis TaxID=74649 RepID=A0A2P6RTT4_ROSCH|nr:putative peptidase S49, ClpP/crotonase-like domain-containing protein [Rosa chinensis]